MTKRIIGFKSDFLGEAFSKADKRSLRICRDLGCGAIEIRFFENDQFNVDKKDLESFDFVSFHAPNNIEEPFVLDRIKEWHKEFGFEAIVVHPDIVLNWSRLNSYKLPIALENMDNNKKSGRTLESMAELMSRGDYKMVLDINHVYSNNGNLKLAEELWNEFKDKISHFHLSGFNQGHVPLFQTGQSDFIEFLKDKDKSIIIESVCKDPAEAKAEFEYIKSYLK